MSTFLLASLSYPGDYLLLFHKCVITFVISQMTLILGKLCSSSLCSQTVSPQALGSLWTSQVFFSCEVTYKGNIREASESRLSQKLFLISRREPQISPATQRSYLKKWVSQDFPVTLCSLSFSKDLSSVRWRDICPRVRGLRTQCWGRPGR